MVLSLVWKTDLIPEQVSTLAETHSIHSHHTFSITAATKNLDDKLSEALSALSLDLEGQLVRPLTIRGMK